MRFLQPLIAAAAMAAVFAVAPSAHAQRGGNNQGAAVIVIDYQQIITTSDVGRDMTTKLGQISQQMQGELQPEAQAIQAEQTSLQTATQGMNEAQIRANRPLNQRVEALAQRYQTFRQRQVSLARDFEYTQQRTLQDFNTQINPIVREVMDARRAGVALDIAATTAVLPAFNATDDVIARLNQRLRTINVSRQSAPAPQAAAPAAGASALQPPRQ